jgi:hypothetical protein
LEERRMRELQKCREKEKKEIMDFCIIERKRK